MPGILDLLRASVRREQAWAETRIDEAEWAPAGNPRTPAHDFLATVPLPLVQVKLPQRPL